MLFWANVSRLAVILTVLLRHGFAVAAYACAKRLHIPCSPSLSGPQRLRQIFEQLGGTFVKFGQMLALQPDILSLEYCNALFDLLDRVSPFPFDEVERTFREELGHPASELKGRD